MARCNLVFDALITPLHLPRVLSLTQRHPDLTVVIDHGAKPQMPDAADVPWHEAMSQLARQTDPQRVFCKLSGLWTQTPSGTDCTAVMPWCESLLGSFGPDRLIWGSDWPVLELAGPYARWREVSLQALAACTDAEKAAILGGHARRVYRL